MLDLDKPVTVIVNGRQVFNGSVGRKASHMADDIARHGDPGRVFPARIELEL
jgi:flagellar motor switch protein FliM